MRPAVHDDIRSQRDDLGRRPVQHLALAQGQQAAQAAVGGAVAGEDDQFGPVEEAQPNPDDQTNVGRLRPHQGPDDPGKGVAVGDAHGGQTQGPGLHHHLPGMGRALQEAEIGQGTELGVVAVPCRGRGRHGNIPCIHHEGARSSFAPVYSAPYSPSRNSQ